MLVDVPLGGGDRVLAAMLQAVGLSSTRRLERGFYQIGHWNFEHLTSAKLSQYTHEYPEGDGAWRVLDSMGLPSEYGVCDTPEQFMARFRDAMEASEHRWVVSFVVILKEDQEEHGWRWHKWGPYIGEKSPQREYLRDEGPEITQATTFHVYRVLRG